MATLLDKERSETNVASCLVRTSCSTIPLQKGGPPFFIGIVEQDVRTRQDATPVR